MVLGTPSSKARYPPWQSMMRSLGAKFPSIGRLPWFWVAGVAVPCNIVQA